MQLDSRDDWWPGLRCLGTCSCLKAWSMGGRSLHLGNLAWGVVTAECSPAGWTRHRNLALSIWSQVLLVPQ